MSFGRNIEIDREELFLILLRTEVIVVLFELFDVIEIKPILESFFY